MKGRCCEHQRRQATLPLIFQIRNAATNQYKRLVVVSERVKSIQRDVEEQDYCETIAASLTKLHRFDSISLLRRTTMRLKNILQGKDNFQTHFQYIDGF